MAPDELPVTPSTVERRIVSVLFADLVGFTTLSEELDPEDMATIQDAYFGMVRETIGRYGGVLEKFIGDAAMAVFGAPRARDDDAERATRAGLALIGGLEQLEARLGLAPQTLRLRVGVNTGEVVHATDGPDAGRVTGDTVNTAARLQTAARPGGVLLGELTAMTVAETVETAPAGRVELKGKADPVATFEAIAVRPHPSREEALGALRAPMLGRVAELTRLREAADAVARDRRAERLTIIAPPGVGKSRLLAELGAVVTAAGATVLRARVRPQATAPYETVAQLLAAAGADDTDLRDRLRGAGVPEARAEVIAADVRRLLGAATASEDRPPDLAAEREARFDAWVTALDALAPSASVWLVEDVHWAGGDLLAFMAHAGEAATARGRLVVATARPSLLESAPEWSKPSRIDLPPLPAQDAHALVEALLGSALPDALVTAVVERSDGTPLFIEELLRTWASVGTLAHDGIAWRLAVEPSEVPMPPTVQAIYAAQLDDLPAAARLVARRGSVAGRRVPTDAFTALDLADAHDGLDALRRRAFVVGPMTDPVLGEAHAYRHALLRDAGYASLARAERARLHVAMAAWLESAAGERVATVAEAIAEHHAAALDSLPALAAPGLPDRRSIATDAASWYERAAEAALALAAHEAADRMLARAVELIPEDAEIDRARLRLRRGQVLAGSADLDAGIAELEAALESLEAALPATAVGFGEAAYSLGQAYREQIRFGEAESLAQRALDLLPPADSSTMPARARLLAMRAWSVTAQGRGQAESALVDVEEAERLATTTDDPGLQLDVLEFTTATRDELNEVVEGAWNEIARRAANLGRWRQAVGAGRVAAAYLADREPSAALAALDEVAALAEAHAVTEQGGWVDLSRAETRFVIGDWDAAVDDGLRAVSLAERYAYVRLAFRTWVVLLPIFAARGDAAHLDRWDSWWASAMDALPPATSPYAAVLRAAIDVWLAAARGQAPPVPGDEIAELVDAFANPHYLAATESIAAAWLSADRADLVERIVAAPLGDDVTVLTIASRSLIRAWLARALGDEDAATGYARAAAEAAGVIGAAWWIERASRVAADTRPSAAGELGSGEAAALDGGRDQTSTGTG